MRFKGDCCRAHDPRWSFAPLSGDGSSIRGGRFNPIGTPALYLSCTLQGAVAEASQGFPIKMEPLTICLYEVDCENIVDLRSEAEIHRQGFGTGDLSSAWKIDRDLGREPRT